MLTLKSLSKKDWLLQLIDTITSPDELLNLLDINADENLLAGQKAKYLFSLRVPYKFAEKMEKGNLNDPLLKQVLTTKDEFIVSPDFSTDPLKEQNNIVPNLLRKYRNRALLLVKGACAINCRYCFRRHFPYSKNQGNKNNWKTALDYIAIHPEIDELILSGGDPLMAKDHELDWLIKHLNEIPHIKRLRIHSRIPSVIPARITDDLISCFSRSRQQILLVNHINHANEISEEFCTAMICLRKIGIILLNQSVLLRGVNDKAKTLAELSNALLNAGVMPYYLNMLDKVQGTAHFMVNDEDSRQIMRELLTITSGYMIPRLVREIEGKSSKVPIDLLLQ